jgi:hypothetical protein
MCAAQNREATSSARQRAPWRGRIEDEGVYGTKRAAARTEDLPPPL